MSIYRMLPLLPAAILLAACASNGSNGSDQQSFVPADTQGDNSQFAQGYDALKQGNNGAAIQNFQVSYNRAPSDPYDSLDLGAALQNSGEVDRALPLYRQAMANGRGVMPADTTTQDSQGMTLDQIASRNCELAGYDQNCNPIPIAAVSSGVKTTTESSGPRKFEVFFDFDKSNLTSSGSDVVGSAANSEKSGSQIKLTVIGHTDSVGSAAYNQALSERRAEAVKAQLIADGVPGNMISTRGVGKSDQMVQTDDQVREPRNRRAEIDAGDYLGY